MNVMVGGKKTINKWLITMLYYISFIFGYVYTQHEFINLSQNVFVVLLWFQVVVFMIMLMVLIILALNRDYLEVYVVKQGDTNKLIEAKISLEKFFNESIFKKIQRYVLRIPPIFIFGFFMYSNQTFYIIMTGAIFVVVLTAHSLIKHVFSITKEIVEEKIQKKRGIVI